MRETENYGFILDDPEDFYNIDKFNENFEKIDAGIKENADNIHNISNVLATLQSNLINTIYPIGSIFISVSSANPSTLLGGTWVSWGAGKVPVGVDTSITNFDAVEKTGGEINHTLSVSEIPSHCHTVGAHNHGLNNHTHTFSGTTESQTIKPTWYYDAVKVASGTSYTMQSLNTSGAKTGGGIPTTHNHTFSGITGGNSSNTANSTAFNTSNVGNTNAHNNLQPYITCYMWKRTA